MHRAAVLPGLLVLCFLGNLNFAKSESGTDKLNIFVVPHSHCDPGWWKTAREYYEDWTRNIITSIVDSLAADERRTFAWAEISFFRMWWDEQDNTKRAKTKELVQSGRLEFVTGAWTMTDEASVHYVDMLHSYTEGHMWLWENLGAVPKVGWSIDAFGHSSGVAYLESQLGFDAMVMNRVHQDTKTYFRENKLLEFIWRQNWEKNEDHRVYDMMTHMLAYPLYDIPNTCGPDWQTCAEFDFERSVSRPITPANVAERSNTLLGQYKEKAKHFTHNNLLIPLGDDFKYKTLRMTQDIFDNYQKLFDYMNANLNVNIRFSNLSDYFAAVEKSAKRNDVSFPVYQGDFFTYNDRGDDYWSGYFTTRPYAKALSRRTEAAIRSAEVVHFLTKSRQPMVQYDWTAAYNRLEEARRTLALFQHHDGITGTARGLVATDYINTLHAAMWDAKEVLKDAAHILLFGDQEVSYLSLGESPAGSRDYPKKTVIDLIKKDVHGVIATNSLSFTRKQMINVLVNTPRIKVVSSIGEPVDFELLPTWVSPGEASSDTFMLYFEVEVGGMGMETYFVLKTVDLPEDNLVSVEILADTKTNNSPFPIKYVSGIGENYIENQKLKISFGSTGLISSIYVNDLAKSIDWNQEVMMYSTHRSGSYIFSPSGSAQVLPPSNPVVHIIKGRLIHQVYVDHGNAIQFKYSLFSTRVVDNDAGNFFELVYYTDLSKAYMYTNKEVIGRFSTNLKNKKMFYTDSNGIDMQLRLTDLNSPIQSNYYPITSYFSIADEDVKITALTKQAMGASSLGEGIFEFMLDRRTNQDDGRGMGESVTDNVFTEYPFIFTIESSATSLDNVIEACWIKRLWQMQNYPSELLFLQIDNQDTSFEYSVKPLPDLPEHINVLTFRSYRAEYDDFTLLLRINSDSPQHYATVSLGSIFSRFDIVYQREYTLTLLHEIPYNERMRFTPNESKKIYRVSATANNYEIINEPVAETDTVLSLAPLQIRTFLVSMKSKTPDSKKSPISKILSGELMHSEEVVVVDNQPEIKEKPKEEKPVEEEEEYFVPTPTKAPVVPNEKPNPRKVPQKFVPSQADSAVREEPVLPSTAYLLTPSILLLLVAIFLFVLSRRSRRRLLGFISC